MTFPRDDPSATPAVRWGRFFSVTASSNGGNF